MAFKLVEKDTPMSNLTPKATVRRGNGMVSLNVKARELAHGEHVEVY